MSKKIVQQNRFKIGFYKNKLYSFTLGSMRADCYWDLGERTPKKIPKF